MTSEIQTKVAVNLTEMARMVGLSRARFNQLKGTIFPFPLYDIDTKRPFYNEELQQVCLEVRRRNCGIDGKPILFYSRRHDFAAPAAKSRKKKPALPRNDQHTDILEGVRTLGLTNATLRDVDEATGELFPQGTKEVDRADVIRQVFIHLQRKNTADNVG